MLVRAGRAEEVRLGAGREHEVVTLVGLPIGGRNGLRRRVDCDDVAELDIEVAVLAGDLPQGYAMSAAASIDVATW